MRQILRAAAVILPIAFAVGAISQPAQASPATASQLALAVTSAKAEYAVGEPIALTFTVTNRSSTPCRAAGLSDGTIQVLSLARDGVPVAPNLGTAYYYQGYEGTAAGTLKTLAPAEELTFPAGFAYASLQTVTPTPGGDALTALWPMDRPGQYQVSLAYAVPPVAGADQGAARCAGLSTAATVTVRVGASGASHPLGGLPTWALVAVGVVVAAVLLVVLARMARRRKGKPTGAAAVVVVVFILGPPWGVGVNQPPAVNRPLPRATQVQGSTGAAFDAALADCFKKFQAPGGDPLDPMIKNILDPTKPLVTIKPTTLGPGTVSDPNQPPGTSTISWNDTSNFTHIDDGTIDPCSELYHELFHAWEYQNRTDSEQECDNTGIPTDEVEASFAENLYRSKHTDKDGKPLTLRTTYGKDENGKPLKLPLSLAECGKPPVGPRRKYCGPLGDQCKPGKSYNDPHLDTFDHRLYDFQAVGEFVAVQAQPGDLTIQTRQSAYLTSRTVSVNTAVAMKVGPDRLGFYLTNGFIEVHVNGTIVAPALGSTPLPGGGTLDREPPTDLSLDSYVVTWADGSAAEVDQAGVWGLSLSVALTKARANQVIGLLGNFDGNPDNDLVTRTGTALANPPRFEQLYPGFADSWRVIGADSLFDYSTGQSTETFTDHGFPERAVTANDVPEVTRTQARHICQIAGVTANDVLDACILDVGFTGQPAFAVSAGAIQAARDTRDNEESTLSVTKLGVPAAETFAGTAGQKIFVEIYSATVPNGCGVLWLKDPNGARLASGCIVGGSGIIDTTVLPTTGTYSLVLEPPSNVTGQVQLRRTTVVDKQSPITIDGPIVTSSVDQAGASFALVFAGTAGQKVFADLTNGTLDNGCGIVLLRAPNGQTIVAGCVVNGVGYIDGTVLPATGQYAIVLDPGGANTGRVDVRLTSATDQLTTIALNGPAVTAAINQLGAISVLSFNATAGQSVVVDVTGGTISDGCGVVWLRAPDGHNMGSACVISGKGTIASTPLPTTGQYAVVLDPGGLVTGQAQIQVHT